MVKRNVLVTQSIKLHGGRSLFSISLQQTAYLPPKQKAKRVKLNLKFRWDEISHIWLALK